MPIPLAIPLITAGASLVSGAFSFFGAKSGADAQKDINKKQLEYNKWLAEQQAKQQAEAMTFQKEVLLYAGLGILFVIILIVVSTAI